MKHGLLCIIIVIFHVLILRCRAQTPRIFHDHAEFYFDRDTMTFGILLHQTCYIMEVTSDEASLLDQNISALEEYELQVLQGALLSENSLISLADLLNRSPDIVRMCLQASQIYNIPKGTIHFTKPATTQATVTTKNSTTPSKAPTPTTKGPTKVTDPPITTTLSPRDTLIEYMRTMCPVDLLASLNLTAITTASMMPTTPTPVTHIAVLTHNKTEPTSPTATTPVMVHNKTSPTATTPVMLHNKTEPTSPTATTPVMLHNKTWPTATTPVMLHNKTSPTATTPVMLHNKTGPTATTPVMCHSKAEPTPATVTTATGNLPLDCEDIFKSGQNKSGVYTVHPNGCKMGTGVYCDMETDGGGWLLFQRRQDGSVNFYRDWDQYAHGFGKLLGEFWLGNDIIHHVSSQQQYSLRIDMTDFNGDTGYALYDNFLVDDNSLHFKLHVSGYHGNRGDSMYVHNNQSFSTMDRDHDALDATNCAAKNKGGWWYHKCYLANLNGPYHNGEMSNTAGYDDNDWFTWDFTSSHNLKKTEMKIRSSVISH